MTITRIYFNALIDLFAKLAEVDPENAHEYFQVKDELRSLLERIFLFNLIPLSFSELFMQQLTDKPQRERKAERISLINDLNFELNECLDVRRLRYGGELIPYLTKIKSALLILPVAELQELNEIFKPAENGFGNSNIIFSSEQEKQTEIRILKSNASKFSVKKRKAKLTGKDYDSLTDQLRSHLEEYKAYIFENYNSIAEWFGFYNKKVRGYVTEAMSEKIYEFRIHSYFSEGGDNSINVPPLYYDFYPAYFSNLEETTDKMASAMVLGLPSDTLLFENPFEIIRIHEELVALFLKNADDSEVKLFAKYLMKCQHYLFDDNVDESEYFDMSATMNQKKYLVKIFHHESRDVESLEKGMIHIESSVSSILPLFVFSTFPGDLVLKFLEKHKIIHLALSDLFLPHFRADNSQVVHWYIQSRLHHVKSLEKTRKNTFDGQELIRQLTECSPGDKDWSKFELIGSKIFKFLFEDNFKNYLSSVQVENDLKNHRRDLLVNNNPKESTSFWSEMKAHFKCSAIVIDFKNYSKPLNSTEFYTITKYLNDKIGNFAIVFSRKGLDKTAVVEQKGLFLQGKLVLAFSDHELIEMIREKEVGKDPIDRFESKKFQLVRSV